MTIRSARVFTIAKGWLPLAVGLTILCGLLHLAVQQNYRQSANDPQIQMAEDAATQLSNGADPGSVIGRNEVDIGKSLSPFMMVFDNTGKPLASNAILGGRTPNIPHGALLSAKPSGENRVTWQPQSNVRSAIVVETYQSSQSAGYVIAGRSLREVEIREGQLQMEVLVGWIIMLLATLVTVTGLDMIREYFAH